jgi:hypothetical protein
MILHFKAMKILFDAVVIGKVFINEIIFNVSLKAIRKILFSTFLNMSTIF